MTRKADAMAVVPEYNSMVELFNLCDVSTNNSQYISSFLNFIAQCVHIWKSQ